MDRTLRRATHHNKRRSERNYGAWQRFCPDGIHCRFCPHDNTHHLCSSGQPHFYRKATEAEADDLTMTLYRHHLPQGGSVLVRRMTVARRAELITAFCSACAQEIGTDQVLCYQRTLATGEVVGIETNDRMAA